MSLRLLLAFCLGLPAAAAGGAAAADGQGDAPEEYLSPAEGLVVIAPDGSVQTADVRTQLGKDIVPGIEALIAKWRFEPLPQGAGPTRVTMKLMLAARIWPAQDRIQVGIQDVSFRFGQGRNRPAFVPRRSSPTLTPPSLQGVRDLPRPTPAARLVVLVHLDEQGHADHVELAQGWYISHEPDPAEHVARWQEAFLASIRVAATSWVIPGYGEDRCVMVPVWFSGYDPLWNRATAMQPAPLSGPCATTFDQKVLRTVGDVTLVTTIRKLLPEIWASPGPDEVTAAREAATP